MKLVLFCCCVLVCILVAVAIAQEAPPKPALPPLEACQADNLDLREALVTWQERAIRAEAALARQQLAKERAAFEAKTKSDPLPKE
jgi:hypothetical protein